MDYGMERTTPLTPKKNILKQEMIMMEQRGTISPINTSSKMSHFLNTTNPGTPFSPNTKKNAEAIIGNDDLTPTDTIKTQYLRTLRENSSK